MKPRRLVLVHKTGRFAGITQIHGVESGRPLRDEEMPPKVEAKLLDGRYMVCERTNSTERAVFYREGAA